MRFLRTLLLLATIHASAQNEMRQLKQLCTDDNSSLLALLSYPDSLRQMAFTASTYAQGFVKLHELQQSSATAFREMAAAYGRNRQKQLWDLSRYPELPALLLANRHKSKKELNILLQRYPEQTRKAALFYARNYETLLGMEEIRRDFETRSATLIGVFPEETRKTFARLLKDPELFSLLAEDLATTITLGEIYKSNPTLVNHFADSVHTVLAEEGRREYEDWKAGISSDTLVQDDLKKVSKKYADETDEDVYNTDSNSGSRKVIVNILPYPYWAGYPYWYRYPYWRPYPWWYELGFYWGPGGSFVFTGMPTYHFGWWYYGRPYYYKHYYRVSHYFDRHHQGHPRSLGGFNQSIRDRHQPAPAKAPRGTPSRSGGGRRR